MCIAFIGTFENPIKIAKVKFRTNKKTNKRKILRLHKVARLQMGGRWLVRRL